MGRRTIPFLLVFAVVVAGAGAAALVTGAGGAEIPRTEPNQVVEVAPGVYFRHGDLEANGHCNNGIVVFKDFVLVIDANFPSGAEACLADVKKITDKPVRFVFDTHHHGDHAYGNATWLAKGAIPIAHQGVSDEMARLEPARWRGEKRADVSAVGRDTPQPPILTFPDRMVIDDGTQRVELFHLGTAHTRGDGFAYLPKQKVLFTGDAVVNGPYNFMGDGDSASWIQVIEGLQRLDVDVVAPGHGPMGDRELLARQRLYFVELRSQVAAAIASGKPAGDIAASVRVANEVKHYVGNMFKDQVAKVHREMTGQEMPLELVRLGIEEGPSPRKGDAGWTQPAKVVLVGRPELLPELQAVAPGVKIVAPSGRAALIEEVADADGLIGALDPEIYSRAKKLRWFQSFSAGVNDWIGAGPGAPGVPGFVDGPVVLTNGRRCHGPNIADQVFSYLLAFSRGAKSAVEGKLKAASANVAGAKAPRWKAVEPATPNTELRGKTMVLIGAGGIGSHVAERAQAFGLKVIAVDPKVDRPPPGVAELHRPADLVSLLPRADFLVVACPFTKETNGLIGRYQLEQLKTGAYLINVARGPIVQREPLIEALRSGKLAGAGIDVTDPEPLPDGDPLWDVPNLIITPHSAGQSEGSRRRVNLLVRENVRRFAAGESLLNVVDKRAGY